MTEVAQEGAEAPEASPEGQEAAPPPDDAQPAPEPQDDTNKAPAWVKPAINRLTREKHDAVRRAELAEAELALARAAKPDEGAPAPAPAPKPEEIDAAAERKIAEREAAQKQRDLITRGVKEFGADNWNAKTEIIANLGALTTPGFMDALLDLPEAPRLVAALADDPDKLAELTAKRPAAMAAAMGRMAAEIAMQKPKEISRTPPPVKPVGGRPNPAVDVAKMTPKEFIEHRRRTAPKHLGGEGKAA